MTIYKYSADAAPPCTLYCSTYCLSPCPWVTLQEPQGSKKGVFVSDAGKEESQEFHLHLGRLRRLSLDVQIDTSHVRNLLSVLEKAEALHLCAQLRLASMEDTKGDAGIFGAEREAANAVRDLKKAFKINPDHLAVQESLYQADHRRVEERQKIKQYSDSVYQEALRKAHQESTIMNPAKMGSPN